jgi:hypothetical protein
LHSLGRPSHAVAMNNLFAAWRHPADIDLDAGLNAADLMAQARDQLVEIPELVDALRLVDVALGEVSAWFDQRDSAPLISAEGR